MRKLFVLLTLLVIASFALSACGPSAPPDEELPLLRVNASSPPDIIDPQKSSFVSEIGHLKLVYEGLTTFNSKLETVPGSAEKWEYSADLMTLTFTLRNNLKYSDGSLLNAERFAYSVKRNINPATAGEYGFITDEIKGAPEWRGGDAAAEAVVNESVKASHANGDACTGYEDKACNTLTLTLSKPAPYFHTVMGIWVVYPAKQELIEAGGDTWWLTSANHIGNGPFMFKTLDFANATEFVPNRNYWGGIVGYRLTYKYIADSAVAFEAYKNNEFDIIVPGSEDLAAIKADAALSQEFIQFAGSCTIAIQFHNEKEPFQDKKVREAFAYALNRDGWSANVDKGLSIPTLTWIPPGYPGYKEGETRWGYDPEKARQAITESSYGSVANLPEIVLTIGDTPRNRTRFEYLLNNWREVFGADLKISLNPVEPTTYTALTKDPATAPQVFRLGWCADYPDPQNWISVYFKTGTMAYDSIKYTNPEVDKIIDQADVEPDPAKRLALYQQAQDMVIDDVPIAMMYNSINYWLVKPWVKITATTPQDAIFPGDMAPMQITVEAQP